MPETGLLVISRLSLPYMKSLLAVASKSVRSKLYVRVQDAADLGTIVPQVYVTSAIACPNLDVRVLLGRRTPAHDKLVGSEMPMDGSILIPSPKYGEVVMGGTFDRLHNGHKVLLSTAILLAKKSIYCGVTDVAMIQKKSLWELISSVNDRMADVEEFVADVSDGIECITFPLDDPFGKSITVPTLEAIVVSQETVKGGDAVNKRRKENGLSTLDMVTIDLLDATDKVLKETKISSSSRRREALGTLLKEPRRASHSDRDGLPYVIGLTGGIASGKSNIAKYLQKEADFEVIDCDKLAHEAYAPGSELSKRLEKAFEGVVVNGVVDRKKLGAIVFNDKERRLQLNNIVWPTLKEEVMRIIQNSKKRFVVVEAAALVEAEWDSAMDELWTVFVPREEAIKRIIDRDGATVEQAESRLNAQVDNKTRFDASHVVFCSLWAYEETRGQVERAVREVRGRVKVL